MKKYKGQTCNQQYGYMLVNEKGRPILIDSKFPIYWVKRVAKSEAEYWNANVIKVWIFNQQEVDNLNSTSKEHVNPHSNNLK